MRTEPKGNDVNYSVTLSYNTITHNHEDDHSSNILIVGSELGGIFVVTADLIEKLDCPVDCCTHNGVYMEETGGFYTGGDFYYLRSHFCYNRFVV